MAYQCRQCNKFSNEAGACPVCNIPMDIKLQNDMPDMTPVVPAVDVTPDSDEVTPMVDPKKTPPEEVPVPEFPTVEGTPAEGGDSTVA